MDDVPGTVPGGKDTRVPRLVSVPVEVPDRVREGCMAVGKMPFVLPYWGGNTHAPISPSGAPTQG